LRQIAYLAKRIAPAGAANGLAQVLIKLTAPGIPDIYQGTEYWDLSLVDPDNRTAVDFAARQATLSAPLFDVPDWNWLDQRAKQLVIAKTLALRKKRPDLFADATYLPLEAEGPAAEHVFAFARLNGQAAAVTAVWRLPAKLLIGKDFQQIPGDQWRDTCVISPPELCGMTLSNVLPPGQVLSIADEINADQILLHCPVALFVNEG